jgi:hypothetical protein
VRRGEGEGSRIKCNDARGREYLGHVASSEAALVGDLGVGIALVEDRELDEAVVGLVVAGAHGAADILREAAVEGHLATLETRAVRGRTHQGRGRRGLGKMGFKGGERAGCGTTASRWPPKIRVQSWPKRGHWMFPPRQEGVWDLSACVLTREADHNVRW